MSLIPSTDSFLHALRRFIARRGQVRETRSDNGTNFVGARRELREAINEVDQKQNTEKLVSKTSTGNLIPLPQVIWAESGNDKYGPHVEFLIPLCAKLNLSSTPDLLLLSPAMLRTLTLYHQTRSGIVLPPTGKFQCNVVCMRRRWRRVQYLCNLFWSRWIREYLPTLQESAKWNKVKSTTSF